MRPVIVYTPPGYQTSGKKYPVLYLVSGTTDTEETWFKVGRANIILDNLIAAKKAEPMIIVMPYGYMNMGAPGPKTKEVNEVYKTFSNETVDNIIPFVEKNFRVIADKDHRAIAGFSRGGGQSLFTALTNLDKFSYIGSYSAYLMPDAFAEYVKASPEQLNKQLKLFFLGVGSEDFLYKEASDFMALLKDKGVKTKTIVTGGGHTWMNARHYLTETLQLYFKP
jgi:enterochelin esterase family protein